MVSSEQSLAIRVNLTLLFYNSTGQDDSTKATTLLKLAEMCQKENQLNIMQRNLENISTVSADWKIGKTERLELYAKCAALLMQG